MAKLGTFRQTATERKLYTIDYSEWLETGESIIAYFLERKKLPTEAPTTEIVAEEAGISAGNNVKFFLEGGVDKGQYRVEVVATTSLSQIKEDYVLFSIVDP